MSPPLIGVTGVLVLFALLILRVPVWIALVLIVDEGPVTIQATGDPDRPTRVVRRQRLNLLFLPVLDGEDGYGITYGVRVAVPNPAGADSRLSFPATGGGETRAAVHHRIGAEIHRRERDRRRLRILIGQREHVASVGGKRELEQRACEAGGRLNQCVQRARRHVEAR